jgi:hypothetical protein
MRADLSHPDLNEEKQGTGNKHTSARVMLAQPTATPVILEVQYTVSQNVVERLSANAANGSYISLLGWPRYLFCDPGVFDNGLRIFPISL